MASMAPPDHTPASPVCLCIARPSLCANLAPGMEWVGLGCLPVRIGKCGKAAPTNAKLSPPWLLASQHASTPHKYSLGFSSPSVCLSRFPSRQRGLSLPRRSPGLVCPVCGSTSSLFKSRVHPYRTSLSYRSFVGAQVLTKCLFFLSYPIMYRSFLQL